MNTVTEVNLELFELGKFFTITGRRLAGGQSAPEMFSAAIDAAWHRLAEDPIVHSEFAKAHAGRDLTHAETGGRGVIEWVTAYEAAYGPLPVIWFTNSDGVVDSATLARYRETGVVVAEWNCSPAPGDGDAVPENTVR
ncbi:hypothetical protein P3T36_005086 [Kitasatospora sp. MAP12-15]|uniref:hypothetical protein n=1 Tax=unclassified Kitasatospora TaxID=2633591 RepID=UPI002475F735|nr:hypothetical protein [Kitasatospora sp. MAP12-44]MDH6109916.1 hypothetical protein [Kitasatospora sp. MAP12-44]